MGWRDEAIPVDIVAQVPSWRQAAIPVEKELQQQQPAQPPPDQAATEQQQMLEQARSELAESPLPRWKAYAIEAGADIVSPVARLLGKGEYADRMNRFAQAVEQAASERDEESVVPEFLSRGVRGAGRSLTSMAGAGMVAGPWGAISAAAGQEANRAITEGRDAGKSGADLAGYAVAQGVVEGLPAAVMQKIGMGGAETLFARKGLSNEGVKGAVDAGIKQGLKKLGIGFLQELPEELVTELGHNATSALAGVDENALSVDSIKNTVSETTVQTALMFGLGGALTLQGKGKDQVGVREEIIAAASEGRTPSRGDWRKWGLPKAEGKTANDRTEFVKRVAGNVQQLTTAVEAGTQAAPETPTEPAEPRVAPEPTSAPEAPAEGVEASPAASVVPRGDVTSIKNEIVDDLRSKRGAEPIEGVAPESKTQWLDAAEKRIRDDSGWPDRLVQDIRKNPRNLNDEETAALQIHYRRLNNAFTATTDRLFSAVDSGNSEESVKAHTDSELLFNQLNEAEEASRISGREWGRTGVSRQIELNSDFSLASLVRRARVAKGGQQLSAEESTKVKESSDNIAELQTELDSITAEEGTTDVSAAVDNVIKSFKPKKPLKRVNSRKAAAQSELKAAWDDFTSRLPKVGEFLTEEKGALDPEALAFGVRLVKAYVNLGIVTFTDFMTVAKSNIGDKLEASRETLKAAWKQVRSEGGIPKSSFRVDTPEMISKAAQELTKVAVNFGITDREEVVDAVHEDLKQLVPNITRRQTMDAISGYGIYRPLSKNEISKIIRDIKGQLQQLAKLEDMQKGEAPSKTGWERRTPTDKERRLIQQVNEAKRRGGFVVTDPEKQLSTALQARKTALRHQIADLEQEIKTREKIVKQRTQLKPDAELEQLKKRRGELKKEHDKVFPRERELTEVYKKNLRKRLIEFQRRIKEGDFSKKPVRKTVLDKEALDLQFQLAEEKAKFKLIEDKLKRSQRSAARKALELVPEALNCSRAIMTSFDLSAVLRQGGLLTASHPIIAAKALPAMFRAFASKKGEFASAQEIRNRSNYRLYLQAKLALTASDARLTLQEEAFIGRWAKVIPFVAGSERAYITYLNRLRADVFDSLTTTLTKSGVPTPEEAKVIANFVNVFSGRGPLGSKLEPAASALATTFFAPRYVASRFQILIGQPLWKGNARTRKLIAREYARTLIGLGTFYGLLYLFLGGEDEKEKPIIEFNPISSAFGQVRIGNAVIDPLSGLGQATTFASRLITGKTKERTGEVVPIRGTEVPYTGTTTTSVIGRFLRSKLSPWLGSSVDLVTGRNLFGEPVTPGEVALRAVTPLSVGEIVGIMTDEAGLDKKSALSLVALLGMGVKTYGNPGPEQFAFKIAEHGKLMGRNKQTGEIYNYSDKVNDIVKQAKKLGITREELSVGLTIKLKEQGYGEEARRNWQERLKKRWNMF